MKEVSCPLCNKSSQFCFKSSDLEGAYWNYFECGTCRSTFIHPQLTEAQLQAAYPASYYGFGTKKFIEPIETAIHWCRRRRANLLKRFVPRGGRILDIGCGNGEFLGILAADGFDCLGIELSGPALDRARKVKGITLIQEDFLACNFDVESFDAVVLWHVYEHLQNPVMVLERATRILKRGGVLMLAFPNCRSLQMRFMKSKWLHLDPPRHLILPSSLALQQLADCFNLQQCHSSRISWMDDTFGWIQSIFNCCFSERDAMYEALKGVRRKDLGIILQFALAVACFPIALLLTCLDSVVWQGGTLVWIGRRKESIDKPRIK